MKRSKTKAPQEHVLYIRVNSSLKKAVDHRVANERKSRPYENVSASDVLREIIIADLEKDATS